MRGLATRSIVPTESALADRCGKAGRSHAPVAATGTKRKCKPLSALSGITDMTPT